MNFSLIFESLWRNPLRTVFTFLSISTAFLLFGYLASVDAAFKGGVEAAGADRLVVLNKQSIINPLPESYFHKISAILNVSNVVYAQWFGGYYKDRKNMFGQYAVYPAREYLAMFPEIILDEQHKNNWLADKSGALIGQPTADKFGWKVGDRITLTSAIWSGDDNNHDWEFNISGILYTETKGFDVSGMLFHYDYLDDRRSWGTDEVGWYSVQVDLPGNTEFVANKIDLIFKNSPAETKTSSEKAHMQMYLNQVGHFSEIFYLIVSVVLIIILIIAANTMTQSVRERISELATLSAIGFGTWRIVLHLLCESLFVIGLAGLFGIISAYLLVTFYGDPTGNFLNFFFPVNKVLLGVALILLVGVLANLSPIYEVLKMDKVQALRKVV